METNRFQENIPVFCKESRLAHRFQVIDQVAGRNIFCSGTTRIKNFAHPYFIIRSQYTTNLRYKIMSQEARGAIPMWLEPGNDSRCDFLAGFYGYRTFNRVMGIIVNQPNPVFFPQYLVPPIDPFIGF